jgi:hypothetical protein
VLIGNRIFQLNESSYGYGVKKYMEKNYSPGKKMPGGQIRNLIVTE